MARGLPARKIGMTQVFVDDHAVGATILETKPCTVVRVLTEETDGYDALQLGYDEVAESKVTRPLAGQFKKAGVAPHRHLLEIRVEDVSKHNVGDVIGIELFSEGDKIDVSGVSRGLGFQGVVKRWRFAGGPASHGSHFHRRPGSVGACVRPGRVIKGRKLPGHMGARRVTVRRLRVLRVDAERNLLVVKGATPGTSGTILEVGKR
jgi:large subunit ribosomal protein L3